MSADKIVLIEVWLAAIPATLFVFLYPALSRNLFQTWIGRALFASSGGLMLLLNLSLVRLYFGRDWLHHDAVLIGVMAVIDLGANFKLIALLHGKITAYREELDRYRAWRRDDDERLEEAAD